MYDELGPGKSLFDAECPPLWVIEEFGGKPFKMDGCRAEGIAVALHDGKISVIAWYDGGYCGIDAMFDIGDNHA